MTDAHTVLEEDWEYCRVSLPPAVSRVSAAVQLSIQAEFSEWELTNVRLYSNGMRKVWLRRRRSSATAGLPGLMT